MTLKGNCLMPSNGKHLKNKSGYIFEGAIYLGCYDSKDNYVEVTEEEYQDYLKSLEVMLNE
jgi:hypothetical protein